MKLRFFVLNAQQQLCRASQAAIRGLWTGQRSSAGVGCPGAPELRLLSVQCDEDLLPQKVFLLRLPLTGGHFTCENHLVLQALTSPTCVTPGEAFQHHGEGWPRNILHQLAVALDVPVGALHVPLGIGGPLLRVARTRSVDEAQGRLTE